MNNDIILNRINNKVIQSIKHICINSPDLSYPVNQKDNYNKVNSSIYKDDFLLLNEIKFVNNEFDIKINENLGLKILYSLTEFPITDILIVDDNDIDNFIEEIIKKHDDNAELYENVTYNNLIKIDKSKSFNKGDFFKLENYNKFLFVQRKGIFPIKTIDSIIIENSTFMINFTYLDLREIKFKSINILAYPPFENETIQIADV